ncbi:Calx-beta domain-containing protein [Humisphaera borealis]|uniref:Calx-beta domain-containing protein n=1 Tax=Humisphaera borealis TaxID=2807512 RepID=A0A7M2WYV9_9BACT|nr:Calx-beta domain-containing protein [Humisphaera borealis]QOV90619.1 hypothetical protein IPV69_04450 [Humisphaera borealis]
MALYSLAIALFATGSANAASFDPFNPSSSSGSTTVTSSSSSVQVPAVAAGTSSPVDPNERSFSISDAGTVTEAAGATLTFTVTLNKVSNQTLKVLYSTANGTAASGIDYVIKSGTLTFSPGQLSKTVTVSIIDNAEPPFESSEFFYVSLYSNSSGTTISRSLGRGTILDPVSALPKIRIYDAPSVIEGNSGTKLMSFPVTLDKVSAVTVSVKYATADGTAKISFNDYVAKSGTLVFSPGQTSKTVTVTINGDTIKGVNETLFVNLSNPVAATILDGQGVGIILNDD